MRLTEDELAALLQQGNVREVGSAPRAFDLPVMTEAQLQRQLREVCKQLGYLHYHTYRSQKSEPGFPDSVIVSPHGGSLYLLELKREGEEPTIPQQVWLDALALVTRVESGVVHPSTLAAWVARLRVR